MSTLTPSQQRTSRRGLGRAVPRPFVKWAGGKGQILAELRPRLPARFGAYHEPFTGGGALFFALYRDRLLQEKRIYLSDINAELVDAYCAIRDRVEDVIEVLKTHCYEKDYYYQIRALNPFDLSLPERVARMIFLNRAGFNGLYRVNSKGEFNVPFGRYTNPSICDPDNLLSVSAALKNAVIQREPFEKVLERAQPGDLVYFDPPYPPLSTTAHFVAYARTGFTLDDHERLAQVFAELVRRGVFTVLSNADTPWVRERYQAFRVDAILARRAINSKEELRGPVGEMIVTGGHSLSQTR